MDSTNSIGNVLLEMSAFNSQPVNHVFKITPENVFFYQHVQAVTHKFIKSNFNYYSNQLKSWNSDDLQRSNVTKMTDTSPSSYSCLR